ncbi:MAG: hypothetical protein WC211_11665 [Dehalococcoidia bacterium]
MASGRYNIAVGLLIMAGFMVLGFVLIYLRDFAPGKEAWVASYDTGAHFETRLAHVHGNLFATLNIVVGLFLARSTASASARKWVAILMLVGLLMPAGILAEVTLSASPIFVLVGALSITVGTTWAGVLALRGDVA